MSDSESSSGESNQELTASDEEYVPTAPEVKPDPNEYVNPLRAMV